MAQLLQGTALIIGGATGIGRATAFAFPKHGVKQLALADINLEQQTKTAKEVGEKYPDVKIEVIHIDVTKEESVQQAIAKVISVFGRINFAINNVGIMGVLGATHETPTADLARTLNLNFTGMWYCERAELKHFMEQAAVVQDDSGYIQERGVIVNTSSLAGLRASNNAVPYVASKHAVVGMTKADAVTYAKHGIRVNAVAPGAVETPFYDDKFLDAVKNAATMRTPLGRVAQPDEIADVIVVLASPMTRYMTGQTLVVDGGRSTVL